MEGNKEEEGSRVGGRQAGSECVADEQIGVGRVERGYAGTEGRRGMVVGRQLSGKRLYVGGSGGLGGGRYHA